MRQLQNQGSTQCQIRALIVVQALVQVQMPLICQQYGVSTVLITDTIKAIVQGQNEIQTRVLSAEKLVTTANSAQPEIGRRVRHQTRRQT